jgi:hypothetical protein
MLFHSGCLCVNFMFCVCMDMTKYVTMFLMLLICYKFQVKVVSYPI